MHSRIIGFAYDTAWKHVDTGKIKYLRAGKNLPDTSVWKLLGKTNALIQANDFLNAVNDYSPKDIEQAKKTLANCL